ncbi:MAG: hypothetical protein CVU69_07745 [Deltaproteobacteria bacterium HGW-Deltaproteobacteria-4]|nr:MAG: hypothetical protein CVU69_07745 [Deltaproteobacteria bacterium HGW-Deltaproteobacteria-4]
MIKIGTLPKIFLFLAAAAIHFSAGSAAAVVKPGQGGILLDTYQRNIAKLETSSFGLPLFLTSFAKNNRVHVDVYGIFDSPFSSVVNALQVPANWCGIVSLHPNVKACTFREEPGNKLLTFYFGRKFYQTPEEAHQVLYHFQNVVQEQTYLDIMLNAEDGPFGTENHRMRFEALPLSKDRTFVHVSYEYNESLALRLAGKAYFSTLGQDKVGFTVTGTDKNGKDIHIGGPRGATERNAVRYYFAIQSFMTTMPSPEKSLFSRRINNWYDLTARYKEQLFELDKQDYLAFKTSEHKNQLRLQRQLGPTL